MNILGFFHKHTVQDEQDSIFACKPQSFLRHTLFTILYYYTILFTDYASVGLQSKFLGMKWYKKLTVYWYGWNEI